MCRVIAVSNQKGGVGKTVSCVNLGIGLAQEGKKVLMIDADPQGSLTISLGYEEPDEMEYSLATLMMNIVNDEKLNIEKTILHHKEGVDLIPANIELSAIEVSLVNAMSRELILRSMVDRLREFYDYIIIDCMPSLGMMTINALACADSVLIPVQAAYLPVKGLQQLIKTIGRVKKQLNPKLKIEGILARQFLLENFVSRGMVVDFAVHQPDREDGGIPNPHFHVLCPIRPIEQNGKWGLKQRRVYELDEDGNRIRDANGKFVFNAVPTTDWGSPETLEHWRQTWAELCNAKFAEKGLDVRIDHRSYERQGVDLLPTIHEGATVRAMEKKGIRTEKGEFNRWIKATNAVIRDIKKKIALLFDWIAEAKVELAKPQAPDLVSLLNAYYTQRRAGAYSQKGKVSNLKEMNETFNYLRANGIYSLEDLESRVSEHSAATESFS